MKSGEPLEDADYLEWIQAVCGLIKKTEEQIVVACCALKKSHRKLFHELGRQV